MCPLPKMRSIKIKSLCGLSQNHNFYAKAPKASAKTAKVYTGSPKLHLTLRCIHSPVTFTVQNRQFQFFCVLYCVNKGQFSEIVQFDLPLRRTSQRKMSDKEPKEVTGPKEQASSASGASTPKTTSELSDSGFNYDIEKNWSMIFTDDNNSTDHDLNSNYSSSADDGETNHDVVSESESTATAANTPFLLHRQNRTETSSTLTPFKIENNDSSLQSNSVSTIKGTEDSYQLPDPINSSTTIALNAKEEEKTTSVASGAKDESDDGEEEEEDGPGFTWNSLKTYLIYLILGVLVVDKGLQLFDVSPSINVSWSKKEVDTAVNKELPWSSHSWTIVRYIADKDVEKPKVSLLSVVNGEPSSWDLIKALYSNAARNVDAHAKYALEGYRELLQQGEQASFEVVEKFKEVDWDGYLKAASEGAKSAYGSVKNKDYSKLWKENIEKAKVLSDDILRSGSDAVEHVKKRSQQSKVGLYSKAGLDAVKDGYSKARLESIKKGEELWKSIQDTTNIHSGKELNEFLSGKEQQLRDEVHEFMGFASQGANALWNKVFN